MGVLVRDPQGRRPSPKVVIVYVAGCTEFICDKECYEIAVPTFAAGGGMADRFDIIKIAKNFTSMSISNFLTRDS